MDETKVIINRERVTGNDENGGDMKLFFIMCLQIILINVLLIAGPISLALSINEDLLPLLFFIVLPLSMIVTITVMYRATEKRSKLRYRFRAFIIGLYLALILTTVAAVLALEGIKWLFAGVRWL